MKADNIQALRDAIAGLRKAEAEYDNYIKNIRDTDHDRYSGARSASNSSLKRSKRCSLTYKK